MTKALVSKRVAPGLYEVTIAGRVFEVEDFYQARGDGTGFRNDWNLFEMVDQVVGWDGETIKEREYCQSFCTKRDAMAAIEVIIASVE